MIMSAIPRWRCIAVILGCCAFCISEHDCYTNRYGVNCEGYCHCSGSEVCNSDNGVCIWGGCLQKYTLATNWTCQPVCGWNRFGDDCQGHCHCGVPSACNLYTGKCRSGGCENGYTVDTNGTCQPVSGCTDGQFGNPCWSCNCLNKQEVCDNITGACSVSGCAAGYQGTNCLTDCSAGTFGVNCADTCHCTSQVNCNTVTGECSGDCAPGWTGQPACQTACSAGTFGVNCPGSCHCASQVNCNTVTGECSGDCAPGWTGQPACQIACSTGTFGVNCAGSCHCASQVICNTVTGECSGDCAPGWTGQPACQTATVNGCNDGAFGNPCKPCNCHNQEVCDKTEGGCPQYGCAAGYRRTDCQQVCLTGTFGVNCASTCHCAPQTDCHIKNGCSGDCADGWTGINCQTSSIIGCPDGKFGNPCKPCNCHKQDVCDKTEGSCPQNGCAAGYHGTDCQQECLTGTFGVNCADTCHCALQIDCNIKTGNCSGDCADGWTAINCQTPTSTGCPDGESGNPCKPSVKSPVAKSLKDSLAAPIGGGVAGLLVIVVVVVVIVIVIRRRKSTDLESEDNSRIIVKAALDNRHVSDAVKDIYPPSLDLKETTDSPTEHQNVANEGTSTAIYANEMDTFSLSPIVIAIPHLLDYVQNKLQDLESIESEFKSIPGGLRGSTDIATRPENISKCRYKGILPYDHSRVVLEPRDSNPSDFINASYINGYVKPKEYIASQGPMNKVPGVTDFWNMAWQQNSDIIVMLTRLCEAARYKCEQYWPREGSEVYGYITVELLATHKFDDFCVRTLQAQAEGKVRTLKMFHFKEWGDHDAPRDTTGIILFREKIHEAKDEARGPIIVHCSAGVGRTGTFIAFDILMKRAGVEGAVDIRQCVNDIRKERCKMVQTKAQYTFLHNVLCDAWYCGSSTLTPVEFTETYETILRSLDSWGKSRVQREFETLEQLKKERKNTDYSVAYDSNNVTKNRDTAALPPDSERIFLATTVPERTDYINAVYLPGYMNKSAYISTQLPVSDTVVDFWRLVYEQQSTTIIMLNEADTLTKTSGVYWPSDDEKIEVGPFEIRHQRNIQNGEIFQRQFGLHYKKSAHEPVRTVRQLCVRSWPDGQNIPSSMNVLVDLFKSTQEWQRQHQNRPVIVHCVNGVDKTALVCTAWAILEKLKSEQVISVMLTVKQTRNQRPNAIHNLEQYRFCYELAKHYLEEFDTYANFQ